MLLLKEITCPAATSRAGFLQISILEKAIYTNILYNFMGVWSTEFDHLWRTPNINAWNNPVWISKLNYVKRHWYPEDSHLAMGFPNHFLFPYIQAWWDLTGVPFTDVTTSSAFPLVPLGKTHPGGHTWRVKPLKSGSIPRTIPPPKNRTSRQVHLKKT